MLYIYIYIYYVNIIYYVYVKYLWDILGVAAACVGSSITGSDLKRAKSIDTVAPEIKNWRESLPDILAEFQQFTQRFSLSNLFNIWLSSQ